MISREYSSKGFKRLYYIVHVNNLPNIFSEGILSKNVIKNKKIEYCDISNPLVQDIRETKEIGDGIILHDYVNLFFNPRNAMMYVLFDRINKRDLCILVVNIDVLDYEDTCVSDGNAATFGTRVCGPEEGLQYLNPDLIFMTYWDDPNPSIKRHKKSKIAAEALVKNKVPVEKIDSIIVYNEDEGEYIRSLGIDVDIIVDKFYYFES